MYEIDGKLMRLEEQGSRIKVALIGVGQMGKDIIAQIDGMPGIEIAVAVDLNYEVCVEALKKTARMNRTYTTEDIKEAEKEYRKGNAIVTKNFIFKWVKRVFLNLSNKTDLITYLPKSFERSPHKVSCAIYNAGVYN